jgi:alpha-tubulin suppressor-like RCC1 family protein
MLVALALLALGLVAPAAHAARHRSAGPPSASAMRRHLRSLRARDRAISLTRSRTAPSWACPESACEAILDPTPTSRGGQYFLPGSPAALEGGGELGGFDPQDLQSAYDIPTNTGSNQTIAVIDAYGYKHAASDLAAYRARYGLPKCKERGGCFRKFDYNGKPGGVVEPKRPPIGRKAAAEEWQTESALDLDMASAACPSCRLMLVEAPNEWLSGLTQAMETAVRLGATEVSNSYGWPESIFEDEERRCAEYAECRDSRAAFDKPHPGVMVFASAGDSGYEDEYFRLVTANVPASAAGVTAVGGTSLHKAANGRGWSEEPWSEPRRLTGSGGGCSESEPKPVWQTDGGCATRTDNDVAAVAACITPVSVYNQAVGGFVNVCGTSASSPLVAGIEAHATEYSRSLPGADAFYADPGGLNDVTAGSISLVGCPPSELEYLCSAMPGYDGPTGNGTPNGPLMLSGSPPVATTQPATGVSESSATLNGSLDPQGSATSYRFEYGTSSAYGASFPVPDAAGGSGLAGEAVSDTIHGLQPQTTYHFRLTATNVAGTTYGADYQFETVAPVVESITPGSGPDRGGTAVTISGSGFSGTTGVTFGSRSAESFQVLSSTSIRAFSAPGDGPVTVTVHTPSGASQAGEQAVFGHERGQLLTWGANNGTYADGDLFDSTVPVEAGTLPLPVTAVSAGPSTNVFLLSDHTAMASGNNNRGQLGSGDSRKWTTVPERVCAPEVAECQEGPYLEDISAVSSSVEHSLALLGDGTVVAWGANAPTGELGVGKSVPESRVPMHVCVVEEVPCSPEHYLREVVEIATGIQDSYALLANGHVMAWGYDSPGQLGDGARGRLSAVPVPVCAPGSIGVGGAPPPPCPPISGVAHLAAGGESAFAIMSDGTAVSWGDNRFGELGDGTKEPREVPTPVCAQKPKSKNAKCPAALVGIRTISSEGLHTLALMENRTVDAWGSDFDYLGPIGELGLPPEPGCYTAPAGCVMTPAPIPGLSDVAAVGTGFANIALLGDGQVETWGSDQAGNLGNGEHDGEVTAPTPVCAPYATGTCPHGPYLEGVSGVAASAGHDVVIAGAP